MQINGVSDGNGGGDAADTAMILIIFNKSQTENSLRDGTCFTTLHDLDSVHLILLIQFGFSLLESGIIHSSQL